MANLALKGKVYPPFEFPIERGKIREFALAAGDDNPIYLDPEFAERVRAEYVKIPHYIRRGFLIELPES